MSSSVIDTKEQSVELRPCPVCGKTPRLIQTPFGTCFVQCYPHADTETVQTPEEAIRLWNRGKMLGRAVETQSYAAPNYA